MVKVENLQSSKIFVIYFNRCADSQKVSYTAFVQYSQKWTLKKIVAIIEYFNRT